MIGPGRRVLRPGRGGMRLGGPLVLGFGVGLVFVAMSVTAMAGIPAQHAGMASGFLMTGHEVGAALGVLVAAVAFATLPTTRAPTVPLTCTCTESH